MKIKTGDNAIKRAMESSNLVRFSLLICITILFTIILYPNLVIKEQSYSIGDVAEKDIKAAADFFIEDKEATELNRKSAIEKVLTVYDYNSALMPALTENINNAFNELNNLIKSNPIKQANAILNKKNPFSNAGIQAKNSLNDIILKKKPLFEQKVGIELSDEEFKLLIKENFSENISSSILKILYEVLDNGIVSNKEILLKDLDKGIILRDVSTQKENLATNLKAFYSLEHAKTTVRVIGYSILKNSNQKLVNLIVNFAQRLLQPNITLNSNETEKRKKFAADEIKPTLFMIKEGEMLLREGERVTDVQLQKLNALKETQAKENVLKTSSGGFMLVFAVLMITFVLYINLQKQSPLKSNSNILFISSLLIAFFLIAKISYSLLQLIMRNAAFSVPEHAALFGIPIAAGAMTVCLFMGLDLAIAFSLVISLLSGALFKNRFDIFLYYLLSSTMAAFWIQECKERKVFIIAGLKLGVLNILLATVICLYITDYSGFKLLWSWGFAFVGGISAGIITSGLAPLIEMTFGFTTNITLLELANLDRPILRKLMLEAPGTYHHSVIVGSMVEAAATAIGANCLLAKVCGYYHDIGKINKPVYFIENQQNGLNKHNKLAPSMSSLILMSHVKDGVEIARENKLGQTIIDTIKEHHGTSLISFFYEKAKQLKGKDAVSIDDFRYPGPKPKTIEAGLVMLADVVEASARTLEDPTPARIQGHVQNSINKIFSDGQLDNCELTLKDLHNIAKSFIKILNGIYHHRIDYPEKTAAGNGKAVNGSIDKQQTKQIQDIVKKPPEEIQIPFKRLGLS